MWVPLIENNEMDNEGADFFIKKHVDHLMQQQSKIDAVILGCTHYPLILNKIKDYLPAQVAVLSQGSIVAQGLKNYLNRHPEMEMNCSKGGAVTFFTTDLSETFDNAASLFYGSAVKSNHLAL